MQIEVFINVLRAVQVHMQLVATISVLFVLAGCSQQPEENWYDQSVDAQSRRDDYIQHQVDAGLEPMEARRLHDRNQWELNTINQAREGDTRE